MTKQLERRRSFSSVCTFKLFLTLSLLTLCGGDLSKAIAQSGGTTISSGPLGKIYFTDGRLFDGSESVTVESVNADGTGLTTLVNNAGYRPRGIVLDDINGHLYWNDFGKEGDRITNPGRTLRVDVDGSNVIPLVDHGPSGVNDIELDIAAGHIYVAANPVDSNAGGVRRFNFDGSGLINLPLPVTFSDGLTLDPVLGHVYLGDPGNSLSANGVIGRTDLDGNNALPLVFGPVGLGRGLALDLRNVPEGNKMYFAQHAPEPSSNGSIYRANLDGSGLEVIVAGLQQPRDVALDLFAERIYWVDELAGSIQSANLDGSDVQNVITGLKGPSSLTLQVANPDVRTQGFWKRVCRNSHPSGEHENIPGYVDCVNLTATFADVDSAKALCERLNPKPKNDKCKQAEAQFMALLLNVCSGRVATCNPVVDPDLGETTVGEVIDLIDGVLSDPKPSRSDCVLAQSVADLINNGVTLPSTP